MGFRLGVEGAVICCVVEFELQCVGMARHDKKPSRYSVGRKKTKTMKCGANAKVAIV